MEVALTMVRLRWALTLATLRKSTWQTIGYVLGIVFGIGALVGVGASRVVPRRPRIRYGRVITSLRGGCTGCCTSR